ncbi:MAG: efflux RND transporter periplasmic adaptor subunit [Phycisphaerae bacterium]
MKRLVIVLVIAVVVLGGIFGVSRIHMRSFLDGEMEDVTLGDLVIPVTASGTVEPKQFIEIKTKASGKTEKISVVAGQVVKKGDVLLKLDPVDELRNVEARQADVDRAQSARDKTSISLENMKLDLPLRTRLAESRLDDAKARLTELAYRWEKIQQYRRDNAAGSVEEVSARAAYLTTKSAKESAETELTRARNNEKTLLASSKEDVEQAEATLRTTKKNLEEAKLRLDETTVCAPTGGMIYSIMVREGEMVQSGTQSLTGGTPLMIMADTSAMFVMAQVDEADIGMIREIAPEHAKPGKTRPLETSEAIDYARRVIDAAENDAIVEGSDEIQSLKGRPVDVAVEAYRSESFQGVIERILPKPQMANNVVTFNVRIRLMGESLEKLLGLQADLEFTTDKIDNVVLVKNDALHSEGRDCFVYVPKRIGDNGPWGEEKIPVTIGKTDGTFTQIISGLEAQQKVWTKRPRLTEKEKKSQEKK